MAVDLKGALRFDHPLQSGITYPKSQAARFIEHQWLIDKLLERLLADVVARQGRGGVRSIDLFEPPAQLLGLLIKILGQNLMAVNRRDRLYPREQAGAHAPERKHPDEADDYRAGQPRVRVLAHQVEHYPLIIFCGF